MESGRGTRNAFRVRDGVPWMQSSVHIDLPHVGGGGRRQRPGRLCRRCPALRSVPQYEVLALVDHIHFLETVEVDRRSSCTPTLRVLRSARLNAHPDGAATALLYQSRKLAF